MTDESDTAGPTGPSDGDDVGAIDHVDAVDDIDHIDNIDDEGGADGGDGQGLPPIGFLGAVQFLTRLPIRLRSAPSIAAAVPWFPIVGAIIGAAVGGVIAGVGELVPSTVAAVIGVIFGVAITGAFHEDGLADTADAFGGWTPERRRQILKDSRHGSYGVAAMTGTILLRVVCLASLGPAAAFAGSVAAHALGRAAAVTVMTTAPPVSAEGLGADYVRSLRTGPALLGVGVGVVIGAIATGWWIVALVGVVGVVTATLVPMILRGFEGIAGDHLGAVEQVAECAVLVVVSGLAARHSLWWR
ncbi:MAG: adenosylcobinamide-GDP ribazoletransferase [Actinomycetota bacterium]